MLKKLVITSVLCTLPVVAHARPVSYPGGWTVMENHNDSTTSLHVHYSPTAKYSVGPVVMHMRDKDAALSGIQVNNLLKRWNNPDSQANFYLKSAVGVATNEETIRPAGFTGFATDWEDRRFFVSYENRVTGTGIDNSFSQSARVGVAPYVAEYGGLHTWFMLEAEHTPGNKDDLNLTPLVRFFKGASLLEIGAPLNGGVLINFIQRF